MDEDERKALLWPPWATNGEGARYEALDDVGKAVWRQTRGQRVDTDTQERWIEDLRNAVARKFITAEDAHTAIRKVMQDAVDGT